MGSTWRQWFAILCFGSILFTIATFVFGAGERVLPWNEPDRHGRVWGFNDPMSVDHLGMALRRATWVGIFQQAGLYGIFLLLCQLTGLGILLSRPPPQAVRRSFFFAAQVLLFPAGWLATLIFEVELRGNPTIDREFFSDVLPVYWWAHGPWVTLSACIALLEWAFRHDSVHASESVGNDHGTTSGFAN